MPAPDAAPDPSAVLAARDSEHLRLLALFHRILAGITFLFAFFPLIHVAIGVGMLLMPIESFHREHDHRHGLPPGPESGGHNDGGHASAQRPSSVESEPSGDATERHSPERDMASPVRADPTLPGAPEDDGATGRPLAPFERAMPRLVGGVFLAIGGIMVLCGWTLAVLMALAGHRLRHRRSRMFCLIVAGLECLFMPLGTILGVFTIIVLMRPSVESAFDGGRAPA